MSFWKSLFGGGKADAEKPAQPTEVIDYNGFRIAATPYAEAGQFQVCGVISMEVAGVVKEHRFIRADRCATQEEASAASLQKARQIVDLLGARLFD